MIRLGSPTQLEQVRQNASLPLLVKFEAAYVPGCKTIQPVIDEIAVAYQGELIVATLALEQDPKHTAFHAYLIVVVPTLITFVDGVEKERLIGLASRVEVRAIVKRALGKKEKTGTTP